MKKHLLILAAAMLTTTTHAQYTGTQMLADLRESGIGYVTAGNFTRGVIEGVHLQSYITDSAKVICIPKETSTARVIEIVRRRLEDETIISRHEPAAGFVFLAAAKEWPCRPLREKKQGSTM